MILSTKLPPQRHLFRGERCSIFWLQIIHYVTRQRRHVWRRGYFSTMKLILIKVTKRLLSQYHLMLFNSFMYRGIWLYRHRQPLCLECTNLTDVLDGFWLSYFCSLLKKCISFNVFFHGELNFFCYISNWMSTFCLSVVQMSGFLNTTLFVFIHICLKIQTKSCYFIFYCWLGIQYL